MERIETFEIIQHLFDIDQGGAGSYLNDARPNLGGPGSCPVRIRQKLSPNIYSLFPLLKKVHWNSQT